MAHDEELFDLVRNILHDISKEEKSHRTARDEFPGVTPPDIYPMARVRMTQFSDNVVFSEPVVPAKDRLFYPVLNYVASLAGKLLRAGVLVRGGISTGWFYHEDNVLFGEALVTAYQMENSIARVPRILVADEIVNDLRSSERH